MNISIQRRSLITPVNLSPLGSRAISWLGISIIHAARPHLCNIWF